MTLVELVLVLSILGTLAAIALPTYTNYMDKARNNQAMADIREMESKIVAYQVEHGAPPDTLDQVGSGNRVDPWGNPYQYLRILGVDKNQIKGKWRKDRFMVPINSDFDLYGMGKDGKSVAPLTAKDSQDDIVRANNGAYVGLASKFWWSPMDKPCTVMVQGKPVVPLQTPLWGEHPALEDQFTHG